MGIAIFEYNNWPRKTEYRDQSMGGQTGAKARISCNTLVEHLTVTGFHQLECAAEFTSDRHKRGRGILQFDVQKKC